MRQKNARETTKVFRTAIIIALSVLLHLALAALAGAVIDSKRAKEEFRQEVSLRIVIPPEAPPAAQDEVPPPPAKKPPPRPVAKPRPKPEPVAMKTPAPDADKPVEDNTPNPTTEDAPSPETLADTGLVTSDESPTDSSGSPSDATVESVKYSYKKIVVSRITKAKQYPVQANEMRIEGKVEISLIIASDGSLRSVKVAKSSGSDILDRAAIQAAERASPYPPVPKELGPEYRLRVTLSFVFPR